MIKFLLYGLIRDKSRSRLPVIVVSIGVMLTVFLHAYIKGFMGDTIEMNAKFSGGHLKVMTNEYYANMQQLPNDLAVIGAESVLDKLRTEYPSAEWAPRIRFGGLADAPDANGETKEQGPVSGLGVDLLSPSSKEAERLNLAKSIVRGALPKERGETLVSEMLSVRLGIGPGDRFTLISSTMYGGMAIYNLTVSGTVSIGQEALDRGMIIADIEDVREALNMEDATGEILGFLKTGYYDDNIARDMAEVFNTEQGGSGPFDPVMKTLSQEGSMTTYISMSDSWAAYISMDFILAMSLVRWNAGLLGGLRRYGEVGIRLAIGEGKNHVYGSMIAESVMIGIAGSVAGTIIGLAFAWLLQEYGIDISKAMKGSAILVPDIIRARITAADYYIGFIPGLISTLIGTMLSGIGIYKRQTANLFKELEA